MTKPLTENEMSVLQENLDLFGGGIISKSTSPKTPKPRKKSTPLKTVKAPEPLELLTIDDPHHCNRVNATNAATRTVSTETINSPEKLLAVRAPSANAAADQLSHQGINVVNYSMEKRDPALKNVADALFNMGLEFRRENQLLHWVLVNDQRREAQLLECSFIELVLTCAWFDDKKQKIRGLKGEAYINACTDLARQLDLKNQT